MNEELLNIFEEARDLIRKQDLSDKTIKYLIDIVDKDIEIASKKYEKLEKALDIAISCLWNFGDGIDYKNEVEYGTEEEMKKKALELAQKELESENK